MTGEVVDQQSCLRVGIKQLVGRAAEESAVWIERRLDELRHKLTEDAAAVNASLVKTGKVHQTNLHPQLQVRLCTPLTHMMMMMMKLPRESVSGINTWNDVPRSVTFAPSLRVFRQHLAV